MRGRIIATLAVVAMASAGCDREGGDGADATQAADDVDVPSLDPALAAHLPEGVSVETAAAGRDLYPTCGVCHGMEGEGTQLGPPLATAQASDRAGDIDSIAAVIRSGVPRPADFEVPMPAYGQVDFTDEQVRSIAAYVYLLGRNGSAP